MSRLVVAIWLLAAVFALASWAILGPGRDPYPPPTSADRDVAPSEPLADPPPVAMAPPLVPEFAPEVVEPPLVPDASQGSEKLAALRGRVLVDGGIPPERVELSLIEREALRTAPRPISSMREVSGSRNMLTDAQGRFAFHRLPPAFKGYLVIPDAFGFEGDKPWRKRREIEQVVEEIVLRLTPRPRMVGRVLEAGRRRPAANAHVKRVVLRGEGRSSRSQSDQRADENGRFETFLDLDEIESVTITAADSEMERFTTLKLPITALRRNSRGDLDFGDIELSARSVSFAVTDPEGKPIAGAKAEATLEVRNPDFGPTTVTNDKGRGGLAVPLHLISEIKVTVEGFWPSIRPVERTDPQPLQVTLLPVNQLIVHVKDLSGNRHAGVDVSLSRDGPIFAFRDSKSGAWRRDRHSEDHRVACAHKGPWGAHSSSGSKEVRFETCASGTVEFRGLWPNVAMALQLLDHNEAVLLDRRLRPMGPSEVRRLDLTVPAELGKLRGRVTDRDGTPVSEAQVSIGEGRKEIRTDHEGRFEVPALAEPVTIGIQKEGYAPLFLDEIVPADSSIVTFQLEEGLQITAFVEDELGRPLSGVQVGWDPERRGHHGSRGEEIQPGQYQLVDLPSGEIPLVAQVGGFTYPIEHDPSRGDATIVTPPQAEVVLDLPARPEHGQGPFIVVIKPIGEGSPVAVMPPVGVGPDDSGILIPNVPVGDYQMIGAMNIFVGNDRQRESYIHPGPISIPAEGARIPMQRHVQEGQK